MKVAKDLVVRCEYALKFKDGDLIESSEKTGPVVYRHGAGKMLPALEAKLEGMGEGEEKNGIIPAEEIMKNDALTLTVPRSLFPKEAKVEKGELFEAKDPQGRPLKLEVQTIDGDQITARAVHPLAGKDVEFRVKILSVRPPPPPVPPGPAELAPDDIVADPESKR